MSITTPRSRVAAAVAAVVALLAVPGVASAANGFQEQRAQARWSITFQCPDGSTATDGRLFLETDNFIDAGTARDPNPPLRVAFTGQCPDGTYSWGSTQATPTQFDPNLKSVIVGPKTFTNVRDNRGVFHTVAIDASWTGTGPLMTTVNTPGSKTMQRTASATARIVFDGAVLVDGASNFPFPEPFIRVDTEK